jgi:hypothetical protein
MTAQTQNKRIQMFMPQAGFESTIPVFSRAKTIHALDRAATVIGPVVLYRYENWCFAFMEKYKFGVSQTEC